MPTSLLVDGDRVPHLTEIIQLDFAPITSGDCLPAIPIRS